MQKLFYTVFIILFFNGVMAQPTAGLVAYWPMNGDFNDAGPNIINGTNNGSTPTTNNMGTANTAIDFSNPVSTVPQFATHPINSNLNFGTAQDFTLSFSVFANSPFVHVGGLYDNNLNYAGPGVYFWQAYGYPQLIFMFKNGSLATTSGAFTLGVWNKISCIRESGTLKIYINGVLNNSGSEGTSIPVYNYTGRFGTLSYAGYSPPEYNGFNGKLDEFRIYNRALTLAEVTTISTLPIKLSHFITTKSDKGILLKWQTIYEQNSLHFIVQRSTDALNFYTIGNVMAKGNSSLAVNYQFIDTTLNNIVATTTVFYRLKSVDIDGRFAYSDIVALSPDNKKIILLFPNPVLDKASLLITVNKQQQLRYRIIDKAGRTLRQQKIKLATGSNSISINLSSLPGGMYWLELKGETINERKLFFKN